TEATALSVLAPAARRERRKEAAAVVDEIKQIATHLDASVKAAVRTDVSAEDAILQAVERGRHDLIVLGVSRRPGDRLAFGDLPTQLLTSAPCSLVFVSPQPRSR